MSGTHLTRENFDAADLAVRRQIAAREFDAEELKLLEFVVERSFRLGRGAAYFRSFRQLGEATQLYSHAHETFKRLCGKKVLLPLAVTTNRWHWYGLNLNFSDWPKERKRPEAFWEEPALPWEPELRELLTETFIENLSAVSSELVAKTESDRGRDAGPAQVPHPDTEAARTQSASPFSTGSHGDSPTGAEKATGNLWSQVEKQIEAELASPTVRKPGPARSADATERTPVGYASVPPQGTEVYPDPQRTPQGYSSNVNIDRGKEHAVPHRGTYIASSASVQKAELAIFAAVPLEGTESYNEKVALAWAYLQKIDLTGGLKVKRFYEQWRHFCENNPDWILKIAPNLIERQVELHGSVPKPLALLAHIARQEKNMR